MVEECYRYVIPTYGDKSIESDDCFRYRMAKFQSKCAVISYGKIIELVDELLKKLSITYQTNPYRNLIEQPMDSNAYADLKNMNPGMKDEKDIVWLKFTKNGFLGVVATSSDINFRMDNTSGKIIDSVGECWNEDYVLIFPLENIPSGWNRHLVESAVGNYLIDNGVPILDYYSHNI